MNITIEDLHKIYPGDKAALSGVNLSIENGLFGLLGPNGAGKTTLMRILVTLMLPSKGRVTIGGFDLNKERHRIRSISGYLPQGFSTFPKLRTWEFLDFSAKLAGLNKADRSMRVDQLLEQVGLFEVRDRMASKLSGGMKRRLGIAQALVGDPKILIVDEPTTGLDPEERIRFRNILSDMARGERIIILSTHIVGDISSTCKDMALLINGRVAFKGSPGDFIDIAQGYTFQVTADDEQLVHLKSQYPVITTIPGEKGWEVELIAEEAPSKDAKTIAPNLEHAYVYFMEYRS